MAHYAFVDENNVVVEVIAGIDEHELIEGVSPEIWYGNFRNMKCIRTSYNGKIRNIFAGVGMIYNLDLDVFLQPACHSIAILDKKTLKWICQDPAHEKLLSA
jgi:hypothetical protein